MKSRPSTGYIRSLCSKICSLGLTYSYGLNAGRSGCGFGGFKMSFEEVLNLASRDEAFKATIYAMNTLLINKGIYTREEFEALFAEWVHKEQRCSRSSELARDSMPCSGCRSSVFGNRACGSNEFQCRRLCIRKRRAAQVSIPSLVEVFLPALHPFQHGLPQLPCTYPLAQTNPNK